MDKVFPQNVRDIEELEGALLPVATQIQEQPNIENPAVPIAYFEYEETAFVEEPDSVAHSLPQNERAAIADDSKIRVKLAEQRGKILSETEKEAIRNMNRQAFSKNYFTKQEMKAANQKAKYRDAEGLQIADRDSVITTSSQPSLAEEAVTRSTIDATGDQNQEKGGYEVEEFSFGDSYEIKDYDVQEYRSVYD